MEVAINGESCRTEVLGGMPRSAGTSGTSRSPTIPAATGIVHSDARGLYDVLFGAMLESLPGMFREVHGTVPAVMSVLHTWDSDLRLHPHGHCVGSRGGLRMDRNH